MERIGDVSSIERRLITELKEVFSDIQLAGKSKVDDLESSLEMLKTLRGLVYEKMNQIPHEALILKTAKLLQDEFYPNIHIEWLWNPRQTGKKSEPDLQGLDKEKVIVSAEITTSSKSQGTINTRMAFVLQKLSAMPGDKYYVVTTEDMEHSAKSKISSLGYQINILRV
ncbi:MAG: hypothetical protein A2Z28_03610 [Chloroflexi bacterium RBG_16_51_9]|nr:MAG: hypothetical protein A2Z28_03610 [Chloroflexi bacterium RBG_16_51_9]